MKFRRFLEAQVDEVAKRARESKLGKSWEMTRVAKDAEPVYWNGGFMKSATRPEEATGIRFAIIAIDIWHGRPSRYDALQTAAQRASQRGRFARWVASEPADRYGKNGEPLLEAPHLSEADSRDMRILRGTVPGQLLYGACALATAIEIQRCWQEDLLDEISIRINLDDEVRQIAASATSIHAEEESLGPEPTGDLAKDSQVMELFERRRVIIDERIQLLFERVNTLKHYWNNLKSLDNEFDRLQWIREKSADNGSANISLAEQERQSTNDLARRAEDAAGVSESVLQSLVDDAKNILKLNENN